MTHIYATWHNRSFDLDVSRYSFFVFFIKNDEIMIKSPWLDSRTCYNTPMSESTDVITLTNFLGLNHVQIASQLSGKTIQYNTAKPSTITGENRRTFKVMEVEDVFQSRNTDQQCVRVFVADMDVEGAPLKYRTLHVNGIQSLT